MFKPNLTRTHKNYRLKNFTSSIRLLIGIVKIAVIRSNLVLAISANIAYVKCYHNTIASLDPILNKLLQESCQLIPFMCVK